jgi:transposase
MVGRSKLVATAEQRSELAAMASGADRPQADRARAILLTLSGWTSPRIAEAFGVQENTVRLWRSAFQADGPEALRSRVAAGPTPVKAEAALRVARPLLSAPVADRTNWTLARLAEEIARQEGVTISRSQLSKVLRRKGGSATGARVTH